MKRTLTTLLAFCLLLGIMTACGSNNAPSSDAPPVESQPVSSDAVETSINDTKTVVFRVPSDPLSPNYYGYAAGVENELWGLCGGVLMYANAATGETDPGMIDEWSVSDDGLVYTFHIHEDAGWSDGEPVTSDDVVWTVEYFKQDGFDFDVFWWNFGYDFTVEKVDEKTFTITVENPVPTLISNFTNQFVEIVPKHIFENVAPEDFLTCPEGQTPIGAGPYAITEYKPGEYYKLVANEYYYDGVAKIKNMTLLIMPDTTSATVALETGEISCLNVAVEDYARLSALDNLKGEIVSGFKSRFIIFNMDVPEFQDKNIRQALNYLFDNQAVSDAVFGGVAYVSYGTFPLGVNYVDQDAAWVDYSYNVAKAKELIEASGYTMGSDGYYQKDGKTLEFELLTSSAADYVNMSLLFQSQCKDGGVKIDLNTQESSQVTSLRNEGNYQLEFTGFSLMADPSSYEMNDFWQDDRFERYDELVELWRQGETEVDEAKRTEIYTKIESIFSEDALAIWGVQPNNCTVHSTQLCVDDAVLDSGYEIMYWNRLYWIE